MDAKSIVAEMLKRKKAAQAPAPGPEALEEDDDFSFEWDEEASVETSPDEALKEARRERMERVMSRMGRK